MQLSRKQCHASTASPKGQAFSPAAPLPRRARHSVSVCASASNESGPTISSRRQLLVGTGLALGLMSYQDQPAAAEGDYSTFLGYATPPTSYGGYGGNDPNQTPKYSFEYPAGWKQEIPSKVEKGTQGIDGRVRNPRVKGQQAVVISLGRAGEDNKSFRLTDLDSTFQGFAGADYDLQDALSAATEINQSQKEVDGNMFYLYDIDSPENRYLASISVKGGKVFALFIKSPARSFKREEANLRHILDTFKLL